MYCLTLERQRREAAADEELRDSELVQVRADRERVLGSDAVEDREHLVVLDELPRLADGLGRVVRVVDVVVADRSAADSAAVVDVLEVRVRPARNGRIGDLVAAQRDRRAEQDRVGS